MAHLRYPAQSFRAAAWVSAAAGDDTLCICRNCSGAFTIWAFKTQVPAVTLILWRNCPSKLEEDMHQSAITQWSGCVNCSPKGSHKHTLFPLQTIFSIKKACAFCSLLGVERGQGRMLRCQGLPTFRGCSSLQPPPSFVSICFSTGHSGSTCWPRSSMCSVSCQPHHPWPASRTLSHLPPDAHPLLSSEVQEPWLPFLAAGHAQCPYQVTVCTFSGTRPVLTVHQLGQEPQ